MAAIQAEGIGFSYSDAVELIADASFRLEAGWVGLVGDNGAGKSTLLRLIAGVLAPGTGRLCIEPADATLVVCPQAVERPDERVQTLSHSNEPVAHRLRGRFALDADALPRWNTLSPGERRRWQIAAALAADPDVLLLDEPTNHIDASTRALLVAGLERFRGVGLVVSHDRALLDALTASTLRIARGRVELFRGSYTQARAAWEAARRERVAEHQQRKQAQSSAEAELDRARRAQQAASRSKSSRRRMKSVKDHDARSALAKGRAAHAEKRHGRTVTVLRGELARAAEHAAEIRIDKALGGSIFIDYVPAPSRRVLAFDGAIARGGRTIVERIGLVVERDSRVHLSGDNGAGKSLLLQALVEGARPDRVLYLPQELDARERRALADDVRALPPDERGRVLSAVAALGSDPARLIATESPSPGEARKLAIASGFGRLAWALALDEPENHLDLPSIERLQRALAAFPGALVLVTHDPVLARACTREEWRVASGSVTRTGR